MTKKDNMMNIDTINKDYDMATAQAMVAATIMASMKEHCLHCFRDYRETGGIEFGRQYESLVEWSTVVAEDLIKASHKSIVWVKKDLEDEAND